MSKSTVNVEELLSKLEETLAILESESVAPQRAMQLLEDGIKLTEQCFEEIDNQKGKLINLKQRIEALDD